MKNLVSILCIAPLIMCVTCMDAVNNTEMVGNSSDPNKDMYVIHAMVYQVGILTNKTDNETSNFNTTGNQEALTFYHNNGSQVDLSQIPTPLVTNVTAQSLVGVTPMSSSQASDPNQIPWSALNHLTSMASPLSPEQETKLTAAPIKSVRNVRSNLNFADSAEQSFDNFYKNIFKREAAGADIPVTIRKGAAVIPQSAGVQSIAIPPLLTLNNNLSQIPVPIPNTSVVHYAKINTLVTTP